MARADYSSVLSTTDANETYDKIYANIYISLYEISCPTKTIRVNKTYIKTEPWVISGILTSSINKEKLLRKKVNKPNPEIEKAYRVYCRLFNKIKRAAKTKHFTKILEERKYSIKETWTLLRQAIYKQKECFKLPQTFSVKGEEISNSTFIAEEFYICFAEIGKSVSDSVPPHID